MANILAVSDTDIKSEIEIRRSTQYTSWEMSFVNTSGRIICICIIVINWGMLAWPVAANNTKVYYAAL